jgi:vancomycin resistance protein VanJ
MWSEGDRSPLATIFLFGPRWLCGLPLLLLVPAAAIWRRWLLLPLAVSALVILVPILGFQLHLTGAASRGSLRIVTCNIAQHRYEAGALARLVAELQPDIVALQECKHRPPDDVWPAGWYVAHRDEYLVASPYPIQVAERTMRPSIPNKPAGYRFLIELPSGPLQLFNLHLSTPRRGLRAVLDRRRGFDSSGVPVMEANLRMRSEESESVAHWVQSFPGEKVVVGDFNMPPESVLFRRDWNFLNDAFSTSGWGLGHSKLTEEEGWTFGTRIDHILYSPPWVSQRCWLGPPIGSDHLPLVADLR